MMIPLTHPRPKDWIYRLEWVKDAARAFKH